MNRKTFYPFIGCVAGLAVLLASCGPTPTPATPSAPASPTTSTAPTAPAVPAKTTPPATPAAPAVSNKPQYGGTITLTYPTFVNYDPYRYEIYSTRTTSFVFEKLTFGDWTVDRKKWGFTDEVGYVPIQYLKGALAESWEVPDLSTIVVHVRKGVNFQNVPPVNGREFTADDVVWNLQRQIKDSFIDRTYLALIDSATKVDKYTVQIKIKPPPQLGVTVNIVDASSSFYIAKETVGPTGEIQDWHNIIGTGPFMIKDVVTDSSVTYERNPNYWGYDELNPANRLPYADRVNLLIIADYSTWLAGLRTGKIDQNLKLEWKDAESLRKTAPQLLLATAPISSCYMWFMKWGVKPYDNVKVRQAISMAIDREELARSFYNGWTTANTYSAALKDVYGDLYTPFEKLPDKPLWTTLSVKEVLSCNPEKAKKLLAEAGYPNGFKTSINITPTRAPGLAEVYQSYLAKIGVQAELKSYEWAVYSTMNNGKKHDQLSIGWIGTSPDALRRFAIWRDYDNLFNSPGFNDPTYNQLFDKVQATTDQARFDTLIKELNYYTLESAMFISLPVEQVVTAWQPWLKGYAGEGPIGAHNAGPTFARVWIDQKLKAARK